MCLKHRWALVSMAAWAGILIALLRGEAATSSSHKPAFKFGVVNIKTCFQADKYERIKEVEGELKRTAESYNKKVQEMEKKVRDLREGGNNNDPSQKDSDERSRQLALAEAELKNFRDIAVKRIKNMHNDLRREVYNEIERVIQIVGRELKYDQILRAEQPMLEEQDEATVSMQIISRVVLYYDEGVDLTPEVLIRLNREWERQKEASRQMPAEWTCPLCGKKNRGGQCTATPGCKGKKEF